MDRKFEPVIETLYVIILFILLACITYSHTEQSISVIKYHFQYKIEELLNNYILYHRSFKEFFYQTATLHRGIIAEQWSTFFYLIPLFLFCDFLSGLNLENIYLFSVTNSLVALALFYYWIRSVWGKNTALYATALLGLSSIFQEIARSGSFIAGSLPLAMIWLIYFFRIVRTSPKKLMPYFLLGLLTAIVWNYYWLLKVLTFMAMAQQIFLKSYRRFAAQGAFFWGMEIIIIPQIFINFIHRTYVYLLLPHDENLDKSLDILDNLKLLWAHILGGDLLLEPGLNDRIHAHLWHPWLVAPLGVGLVCTIWRAFKRPQERWLLVLTVLIYIPPVFFKFYAEARHSLLYIIPSFCFIGLGLNQIFHWIHKAPYKSVQMVLALPLLGAFCWISNAEMNFFQTHILSDKRDIGLLAFADGIKRQHIYGNIFYIQKQDSPYLFNTESNVLRMALIDDGTEFFKIQEGGIDVLPTFKSKKFYIVQSPNVSQKDFDAWCLRNHLKYSLLFQSPLVNMPDDITTPQPFKLYRAYFKEKRFSLRNG